MKKLPPELRWVDFYVTIWARWARNQCIGLGFPALSISAKMIEWHELGLSPSPSLYRGELPAPTGAMLIDAAVARLPPRYRRALIIEYFSGAVFEVKARMARVNVFTYRERVKAALWWIEGRCEALGERENVTQGS